MQPLARGDASLVVGNHVVGDGLGIVGPDVDNLCAVLQRTVVLIGANAARHAYMGKARTVVSLHHNRIAFAGLAGHFLSVADGHHTESVGAGLQSYGVGPVIGAV